MITLNSWQPHGHCRWCARNGGCPCADFGLGFHRDIPLCLRCLTHAIRIRLRESGDPHQARMLVVLPPDIAEAAMRRVGLAPTRNGLTFRAQASTSDRFRVRCSFELSGDKIFAATAAAISLYGMDAILECLARVQQQANGLATLESVQVFEHSTKADALWFIDDNDAGAVVALLSTEY
jgi:hypothetical protein